MQINLKNIEENVRPLGGKLTYDKEFIFELLTAYGRAQSNITRLRNGQLNVANDKVHEVAQKGVVYFKSASVSDDELYAIIDDLKTDPTVVRYSTRFVIVTNYDKLLAIDTRTNEPLDISIREIDQHYAYFLPWAGMEKAQFVAENHADVKAAEKMAKLFDILVAHNHYRTADEWHTLTIFFTRLLFCFFAEDTNIFSKNQFVNAVASYTQEDGSDLKDFLHTLFDSLDAKDKGDYPSHLAAFPYVNGRLFSDFTDIPEFNKQARDLLLESASKLDWSDINPDIFGSMFQAVVQPGERTSLGQHYTSVPNIMKTIEPLFLGELREELNNSYDDARKLEKLLARISNIKIFDPACGSGNFLIIAYKELRRLEHAILERQTELTGQSQQAMFGSRVNIENFYGIEIDDFAHEIAILSLWLAKHQMNIEFSEKFGIDLPLIPLKESGAIFRGNATRVDWNKVCHNNGYDEIYVIGNPPYLGQRNQQDSHKADLAQVFEGMTFYKKLDYVACWFMLACRYMTKNVKIAFISTSSINQGVQIEQLWPRLLKDSEICFAYTPFKWTNSARDSAGVVCVVIGLSKPDGEQKVIYSEGIEIRVGHINPYLVAGRDVFVSKTTQSISGLPKMVSGCQPSEGGFLMLSESERSELISSDDRTEKFIMPMVGSDEFIKGNKRYCIWIEEDQVKEAMNIPLINARVEAVRKRRTNGNTVEKTFANVPYRFVTNKRPKNSQIVLPAVSTDAREYIPIGILDRKTIVNSRAYCLYDSEPWVLGVLISRLHMVWVKTVAGRLGSAINYSSHVCYNTFPVPDLSEQIKSKITGYTLAILDIRENHPEKNLAEMYDPVKMPDDLRSAHRELDEIMDSVYRKKTFDNDEERLAHLFDLYETMTANERKKS